MKGYLVRQLGVSLHNNTIFFEGSMCHRMLRHHSNQECLKMGHCFKMSKYYLATELQV